MTLTAHAIVGGAIASIIPKDPAIVFCAAFASHFLVDAIPHFDISLTSASVNPNIGAPMKYDKALFRDFLVIGADALLGIVLAIFLFSSPQTFWVILLGACAGILPDALQFLYVRFRHEPLISLQRFHRWIHTRNHLKDSVLVGISSQVLFLLVVVAFTYWSYWWTR